MIRKLSYLLVTLLCIGLKVSAQQACGFDHVHAKRLAADPNYLQKTTQFNTAWSAYNQQPNLPQGLISNTSQGIMYEIPVVIHVIHTGGAIGTSYNPTDARLIGMIDYLNATYASTWAGYPDSLSGGTRFPIRFVLAKRAPNCIATSGINRVNGNTLAGYTAEGVNLDNTAGADEDVVKALSRWSNHDYYNIWVVNKIDGRDGITGSGSFVAGYAYFPGVSAAIDGTVMLASQAVSGEKTLPHEIGHAFSLYHTFQGGSTTACPPTGPCATTGDLICDTEPQRQSAFNCPSDPNPCTGLSYNNVQRNMMDYSNCADRFTVGQRTRFFSALLNSRPSLISSLGVLAPTTPGVTAAACIPTITTPATTANAGVYNVVLNDMNGKSEGGYNSDGNQVYIDRACIQRANLLVGNSYPIRVTTGPSAERVRVYIDYNNDGIFGTTAPELVYSHDGTTGNETHVGTFTVPTTGVVSCVPLRMRVVSDRIAVTAPTACGPLVTGQAEDFSVYVQGPSNVGTVSIALTAGTNPSCINTSLTFTATPAGLAVTPTYKWYLNGVAIAGATASTYTNATLINGSVITSRIFYTGPCGADSSLSNSITVSRSTTITPSVTIALTNGTNPGCTGQSLTFTATPANGGTAPSYTWQTSPNNTTWTTVAGPFGNTFTTTTLPCNSYMRAILTSNLSCASPITAASPAIQYTCNTVVASATITQTGGTNPICKGRAATFTAVVTAAGPTPNYSWLVNGTATGVTALTFTSSTLNDNDQVSFLLVSSNPCVPEPVKLSNLIVMKVIPLDTPTVYVAITKGSNPSCQDSLIEFTATASSSFGLNGYRWYVNGVNVASGTVYSNPGFQDGDKVAVNVTAGPGCHVRDSSYSDTITVRRIATPAIPFISFIGNMLVSNVSSVQWYGPNGLIPGATSPSYHPPAPGNYYAVAVNNGCPSLPSNILQVSLLTIGNYNLADVQIYPNPTSGLINFDWGSKMVNAQLTIYTPTGQMVMTQQVDRKSVV